MRTPNIRFGNQITINHNNAALSQFVLSELVVVAGFGKTCKWHASPLEIDLPPSWKDKWFTDFMNAFKNECNTGWVSGKPSKVNMA